MSKKFVTDDTLPRTGAQPAYQMVWHPLEGKEYSSAFLPHIKELEAKLLKEAKEKALFLEKEAYEKGFAQGKKMGRNWDRSDSRPSCSSSRISSVK